MSLRRNYSVLPDGYSDTLVMCESLNEIMSDKLISLAATTRYIRYRDLWDLPWLMQQNAVYEIDLVKKKSMTRKFRIMMNCWHNVFKALVQL